MLKYIGVRGGMGVALLSVGILGWPTSATAQGLTATVAPEYERARWGDAVGLDDADLFGGSASLGFGRYVFVRASYKRAPSLGTSLGGSGYGGGDAEENSVDVSLLSTDVHLRLGGSRVAPVLLGGGGILGLSPDSRDDVQQVAIGFGGGLDARILPWLNGQLLVKNLLFRLDRSTLAGDAMGGGVGPDPEADDVRSSWTFTAGLGARLGGGRPSAAANRLDDDFTQALSGGAGLMIPVELQASMLRFSDALSIGDQATLGLRAGLDFGPYFGIRGSYARALDTGPVSLVGMSTWTGEAQFNVGRVTGWSPHLLLGFGQMTFWGDFRDDDGLVPNDKDALILGAGLGVPLWNRSRLIVSLRDYLTSAGSVSGVSSTSDLRHNFGLSVGISYNLREARPTPGVPPRIAEEPEAQPVTEAAPQTPPPPSGAPAAGVNYQSDRVVSLPLPTQGQLIIRYGPEPTPPADSTGQGAGAQAADTSDAAGAVPADAGATITPDDLAALEQRLMSQLAAAIAQLEQARQPDSVSVAAATTAAAPADSLEVVTRGDLEAMEARLTEALAATVREEAAAATLDTTMVASLVRRELEQALPADSLSPVLTTLSAATPDSAEVVTRGDLEAMEARLTEALAATVREEAGAVALDSAAVASLVQRELEQAPAGGTEPDALAELSRQVEELAQLVRQRADAGAEQGAPPVPTPVDVTVPTSVNVASSTNRPGGPVFRGVSGRLGPSRIRDSGTGFGAALDVALFDPWRNRIHPYLGLRASTVPVQGVIGGAPYEGDVTSVGGVLGASLDLVTIGPVRSAFNAGLSGIGGGTSGNTPADESIVDDIYGGFVMGPKVSLDLAWSESASSRWSALTSIGRRWAGARGGWSFHVGFQWLPGGVPGTGRPLFLTGVQPPEPEPALDPSDRVDDPEGPSRQPPEPDPAVADSSVAQAQPEPAPAATPDSALVNRLTDLERTLREERAVADSLAESARLARERADSLRVAAEAAEQAELERERAAEERAALRADLEGLIGVVDVVQSVRETERGLEVVLGGELFAPGSTTLEGTARTGVVRVARILAGQEAYELLVDGHTDATGSAELNMRVSRDRASEVRGVLLESGISPDRVEVVASGEESPLATNDTAAGRALNRRVEIVLIDF